MSRCSRAVDTVVMYKDGPYPTPAALRIVSVRERKLRLKKKLRHKNAKNLTYKIYECTLV